MKTEGELGTLADMQANLLSRLMFWSLPGARELRPVTLLVPTTIVAGSA